MASLKSPINRTWLIARPHGVGTSTRDQRPDFAETVPMGLPPGADEPVWSESSFDLRYGMDMYEQPIDTLPGDLRELFAGK